MKCIKNLLKSKNEESDGGITLPVNIRNAFTIFFRGIAVYWFKPISENIGTIKTDIIDYRNNVKRLVTAALLAALAAILQSAGALGGPGFIISALATLPIALCAILEFSAGVMAYITAICLLLILQPGEIAIFPFTTGLLGLGLGAAVRLFKKRIAVTCFASLSLAAGILILLCFIKYPVLGPSISSALNIYKAAAIYVFSFFYSWLWIELSVPAFKLLSRALIKSRE